ncbi:MAG: CIA30 family protein [Microcystis sp. M49637_WE12]|nr:CIA30 family protein [Microcystis sp. M49637_WE12]
MAESKSWDFQRFWQTLDYFDSIPLWSCLQKLLGFGEDKKNQLTNEQGMKTILVIGGENAIGRKVITQLQQQNYQIRALVDNIESARQLLAENVDLFALQTPQLFTGIERIIYCQGENNRHSLANLLDLLKNAGITAEKTLFDFSNPSSDIKEIWGAVDDVVMGGVSESQITLTGGRALFSGIVRTENNGGFASVRTRNLNPPLNLSNYEGIELQVQGDGKRYKLILRCEGRWDGIGYCYSFDTLDRTLQKISIPFRDLIPVLRAKTMRDVVPFDSSSVYALQLMQSKFEYDGALNPCFSPGLFALEIVTIKAYGGKNRLIIVKEGEIAEKSLLDASGYPYEAIDSAQIFAKLN